VSSLIRPLRRTFRVLYVALAWLAVGVLPNHLSCSRIVQDSVADGAGIFLTTATTDVLNLLFLPEWLQDGASTDGGDGNGDPFQPPVQM